MAVTDGVDIDVGEEVADHLLLEESFYGASVSGALVFCVRCVAIGFWVVRKDGHGFVLNIPRFTNFVFSVGFLIGRSLGVNDCASVPIMELFAKLIVQIDWLSSAQSLQKV